MIFASSSSSNVWRFCLFLHILRCSRTGTSWHRHRLQIFTLKNCFSFTPISFDRLSSIVFHIRFLVSFQTATSHCDLVWNVIFDDIDAMLLPVIDFVERDVKSKWQHRIDIWWMSSLALRCAPLISISIDENETEKIMISFLSLFFSSRFVLLCFRESEINECWVKFFALSSVD